MIKFSKELLSVLNRQQRQHLFLLQILVVLSAVLELIGVLSIAPFMAIVSNQKLIQENQILYRIFQASEIVEVFNFLVAIGAAVLGLMTISTVISILTIWRLSIFAAGVGAEFGDRLYQYYMSKNYLYHSGINSSDLTSKIATEVHRVTDNVLQPIVQINARVVTILFIGTFLFLYDPKVAAVGVLLLSTAYFTLFFIVRHKLDTNGRQISASAQERFLLMNEGFAAIKEIGILGRKNYFIEKFKRSGQISAAAYGASNGLYNMPRYIIELIVYGSMIGFILYLIGLHKGDVSLILPVVGMFGIGALKLLPSFQQIYSGAAQIKNNQSAFNAIRLDLINAMAEINADKPNNFSDISGEIAIVNGSFRFLGRPDAVLKEVSVRIPFKSCVGIIGPSGSGKTTLLDVLIGSIGLDAGNLMVGGKIIDEANNSAWQNKIGYVSQVCLLKDGSIAENIAFGLNINEIDNAKILEAGRRAYLQDWVITLPSGYDTQVGERGIQISGGQRQRIAIARALYRQAEYFFLDEATSALDGESEKKILEAILGMNGEKTVVMIAHRLNTIKICDYIYLIVDGKIKDEGTYNFLMNNSDDFKKMLVEKDG